MRGAVVKECGQLKATLQKRGQRINALTLHFSLPPISHWVSLMANSAECSRTRSTLMQSVRSVPGESRAERAGK